MSALRRSLVASVLVLAIPALRLTAHDIPTDVRIQAFLKPEGQRLRLLVRAPMAAMNDIDWPVEGVQLRLADVQPFARTAASRWIADRIDIHEEDTRLDRPTLVAVRVALPSDLSFDAYERALAATTGPPLPSTTELAPGQGMLDVLFEYRITSDRSRFSIAPRYALLGLKSTTVLRFLSPGRDERLFQFHDDPGLVRLDPRWLQAASRFTVDGFQHILGGIDHLLFLVCLVVPFRRFRALVPVVTSFTVAHSVTLIASAYDMAPDALWFPPLVETLIAATIVYMALENIVAPQLKRRWMITFFFGLIHGFGFSFALRDGLQLAGDHLLTALLSFNAGVELGQLLVLAIAIPVLTLLLGSRIPERAGVIVISALVAHTGWHWLIERGAQLRRYQFQWPVLDAAFFVLLTRWLMIAIAMAAAAWLASLLAARFRTRPGQS